MNSYRDILYADYSANFGDLKSFDQGRSQFPLYETIYSSFDVPKGASILDVGCGKGEWLGWLQRKGYQQLAGVDGSPSDLAIAGSWLAQVQLTRGNLLNHLDGISERYDVIHAKDVIEHLTKDEIVRFLQGARRCLNEGGQIWIQTFNAQAPLAAATRYGDFTHETGLTPQSLAQCLSACGFRSVSVHGVHYCSPSFGGRVRRMLSLPVHFMSRLILRLRHGGGSDPSGTVDRFCVLPDMLAVAFKS